MSLFFLFTFLLWTEPVPLGYTDTLFLLGKKENRYREIVNSIKSLRWLYLSKPQLCLKSMWHPHCPGAPLMTYSSCCFCSHPLLAGDAAVNACLLCGSRGAGCAGCMRCDIAGSLCRCRHSGLLHTCREMVWLCSEHLFAGRRSCFACSDILPLVQLFIPRPTEDKLL